MLRSLFLGYSELNEYTKTFSTKKKKKNTQKNIKSLFLGYSELNAYTKAMYPLAEIIPL